jgi:hypothetical protein
MSASAPRGRRGEGDPGGRERAHEVCVSERPDRVNARIGVLAACVGGGEGGIRTRDALPRTAFPVRRHSPLGDLSGDAKEYRLPACGRSWSDFHPGTSGCDRKATSDRRERGLLLKLPHRDRPTKCKSFDLGHVSVGESWTKWPENEGADRCVRSAQSMSAGGEGGIRTRGAFAHRFSRAAPSTTRTPLRGRG